MVAERSLIFVDNKTGRGGGQVVLEELLAGCAARVPTTLVMPEAGVAAITIPETVQVESDLRGALRRVGPSGVTVVANTNSAFPVIWSAVARLRPEQRKSVRTVGIVHNYPSKHAKGLATKFFLRRLDEAYVVEPGLTRLRSDATVPPWLSIRMQDVVLSDNRVSLTRRVKSFARPDRSKGMHLLPALYEDLERAGWTCQVALGQGLEGDRDYEAGLRRELARWLVEGGRSIGWVEPGDVFVVPSISGEAACLSAQEALARGAFVAASELGLMPILLPIGQSLRTFPVGDIDRAADLIRQIGDLDPDAVTEACVSGSRTIASRRGAWYDYMVDRLCTPAQR